VEKLMAVNLRQFEELTDRLRPIVTAAFDRFNVDDLADLDEEHYDALRRALLKADATDREIDQVGLTCVCLVVQNIGRADPDERERQFDLICDHLLCTRVTVALANDDSWLLFQLPDRPRPH
jgi:hypothetical protein